MDEKQERRLRRKAIRLWLQGKSDREIQQRVSRSLGWIHKWQHRYIQAGWSGLTSQSHRPLHDQGYSLSVRQVVLRVRHQLSRRKVGRLIGARAIQREIRRGRLLPKQQRPSRATIYRILHTARLTQGMRPPRLPDHPHPRPTPEYIIQAMDWVARYLEGGGKVYAFHSLDLAIHDLYQTVSDNKQSATAETHALNTWEKCGLPHALVMDNDAVWRGSLKATRFFSRFMRLVLWLGIEPIFTPVGEPEFNGAVERVNGLWNQHFWKLDHFESYAQVTRRSPHFVEWYRTVYEPPCLGEHTPAEMRRQVTRCRLTHTQRQAIPDPLPLTAGRIHFICQVDEQGNIEVLHELWPVSKRLTGGYVWATLVLQEHRLRIYYRRSKHEPVCLLKVFRYKLDEPVVPLQSQFKRFERRRNMFTML
jgi:transposase InsO family protein